MKNAGKIFRVFFIFVAVAFFGGGEIVYILENGVGDWFTSIAILVALIVTCVLAYALIGALFKVVKRSEQNNESNVE